MQPWDRRLAIICGGFLCLIAIGHGYAFAGMARSVKETSVDRQTIDAIQVVWLSVSAMLAMFGLLLLRAAVMKARTDGVLFVAMGTVLASSGAAGLLISSGQWFWAQHILLGGLIIVLGWRARPKSLA